MSILSGEDHFAHYITITGISCTVIIPVLLIQAAGFPGIALSVIGAQDRYSLNPYELRSPVVSATGARASAYSACIALSVMVGILSGRRVPFFFLM